MITAFPDTVSGGLAGWAGPRMASVASREAAVADGGSWSFLACSVLPCARSSSRPRPRTRPSARARWLLAASIIVVLAGCESDRADSARVEDVTDGRLNGPWDAFVEESIEGGSVEPEMALRTFSAVVAQVPGINTDPWPEGALRPRSGTRVAMSVLEHLDQYSPQEQAAIEAAVFGSTTTIDSAAPSDSGTRLDAARRPQPARFTSAQMAADGELRPPSHDPDLTAAAREIADDLSLLLGHSLFGKVVVDLGRREPHLGSVRARRLRYVQHSLCRGLAGDRARRPSATRPRSVGLSASRTNEYMPHPCWYRVRVESWRLGTARRFGPRSISLFRI
jgi:hypothetical protein